MEDTMKLDYEKSVEVNLYIIFILQLELFGVDMTLPRFHYQGVENSRFYGRKLQPKNDDDSLYTQKIEWKLLLKLNYDTREEVNLHIIFILLLDYTELI